MKRFLTKISVVALAMACAIGVPNAASAQSTKWIVVHNKTSSTISGVYFSEPYSSIWGSDFLGLDEYIEPDEEYKINVRSDSCIVDMKVHFSNGIDHTIRFNICSAQHIDDLGNKLVVAF